MSNCIRVTATFFDAIPISPPVDAPTPNTATLKPPPPLAASLDSAVTATSNFTAMSAPLGVLATSPGY
jgi:hypothetical protein